MHAHVHVHTRVHTHTHTHTHVYTFTQVFIVRAAKARLQRLEKETKEMEKSLETLRHSQAKLAEMERINKKLNSQSHEDKKELFKLKEVYNYV